jgi:hypothetical protein
MQCSYAKRGHFFINCKEVMAIIIARVENTKVFKIPSKIFILSDKTTCGGFFYEAYISKSPLLYRTFLCQRFTDLYKEIHRVGINFLFIHTYSTTGTCIHSLSLI